MAYKSLKNPQIIAVGGATNGKIHHLYFYVAESSDLNRMVVQANQYKKPVNPNLNHIIDKKQRNKMLKVHGYLF